MIVNEFAPYPRVGDIVSSRRFENTGEKRMGLLAGIFRPLPLVAKSITLAKKGKTISRLDGATSK